jgi:outer membrane receptor protein involved in Fe transport
MKSFRSQILATTLLSTGAFFGSVAQAQDSAWNANSGAPAGGAQAPAAAPAQAPAEMTLAMRTEPASAAPQGNDIIITGSRIPQPNLQSVAPVTVVSSQDIKLQGTTKVEDLLNSLPSVSGSQSSGLSNSATGAATVDLRGLGVNRTLVLVNGRRIIPGDPFTGSAADINIIPSSIVKRIEVLTGGASSTYGADAVSGVVNFILDSSFSGIRFDGQYSFFQHNNNDAKLGNGSTMRGILDARIAAGLTGYAYPKGSVADGGNVDATVSIGTGFDDGHGHAVAYFGYRKTNPILQQRRDYSACTIQNFGSGLPRCGGSATSANGNIIVYDDFGTPGAAGTTVYTFTPGGGLSNTTSLYNFAPTNYFQRPDERYVGGFFANYEISDAIKPYAEFMFMDDRSVAQIAPSGDFGNTQIINCDNPLMSAAQRAVICDDENLINGFLGTYPLAVGAAGNPNPGAPPIDFIDPVTGRRYNKAFMQVLRRNVEGGPRRADFNHSDFRGLVGAKGDLDKAWSYDGYFQYARVNYSQVFTNEVANSRLIRALDVIDDPRTPGVVDPICRSVLDGTDPSCVPYNLFGGAGAVSPGAVNYVSGTGILKALTSEQVANFNLTGALGNYGVISPWASDGVAINLGLEYRKETLDLQPDQAFQSGDLNGQGGPTPPIKGGFRVLEWFAETQVPIVKNSLFDELSLSAGYRKSYYKTDSGRKYNTDTYKIGLEFAPVRDVRFRAAYNRAARAPNIQELFTPNFVALDGSEDPCADKVIAVTDYGCRTTGLLVGQSTAGNPAGQYNGRLGGNPDLKPEKATTTTLGVVLQPRFLPRFALTVDWYDIKIKDAIHSFGADAILADCVDNSTATAIAPTCRLVRRDPGGSIWLIPGSQVGAGYVDDTPQNVGLLQTRGIEANATYSHRLGSLGNLTASFMGTYLSKYKVDNGLTPVYDCAGLYGPTCSSAGTGGNNAPLPKWRHKLRTTLQTKNGIGLSLQWRMIGKVKSEAFSDNQSLKGPYRFDPGARVKAQNYFDLASTFALDHYAFRVGMNNIFDRKPPLVTSGNSGRSGSNLCPTSSCSGNTYPSTWDYLGRYIYAGATLDF